MASEEVRKYRNVLTKRFRLFAKKNADYGSSFTVDGLVGIVLREGDKLMRLKTTSQDGYAIQVKEEGLKELFMDIANYCDMGLILMGVGDCEEKTIGCGDEPKQLQQSQDYSI